MPVRERAQRVLSRLRPDHLLPAGALAGLALAVAGTIAPEELPPMGDAAALVNGVPISRADHHRTVEALSAGKRNPLDAEDLDYALSRLIEEELLIQRSIELGLHRTDAMARKRLVASMLEWIAADTAEIRPGDGELRAFFERNADLFTPSARAKVKWFHIARSTEGDRERAAEAARRLSAGEPFDRVATSMASPSAMTLPAVLLPPAKLQDYLGASLTREALGLKPGAPAGPYARADGWHFLLVQEREIAAAPDFEDVREQVEAEFIRQKGDAAVRRYLDWLSRRADIIMVRSAGE